MVKIDELFTFPIIMIDGEKEEERDDTIKNLGIPLSENEDPEILVGEAMLPHWDFLFIRDRWNLTEESYKKALSGHFECCIAVFDQCATFIVPMKKEKFLKKLNEFREKIPKLDKPSVFFLELQKNVENENKSGEGNTGHNGPEGKDRSG
jgi:hypothetical protein